jgi:putative transposase
MHREFPKGARKGAATITRSPSGRYFLSVVVKFSSKEQIHSKSNERIGIDLNLKEIVLSNGKKIETPKIMKTLEAGKRRLQKKMQRQRDQANKNSREYSESKNYQKTRRTLAKVHERIKNQKEDYLRKLALQIYRESQSVAMETLNIKGMMKNRRLARSIAFQSWGRFTEIMKVYAVQYDKQLHLISQWFPSSKLCHGCGYVNQGLTLGMREWACDSCGCNHDRDINAAKNIKSEGGSCPVYKPVERKGSVNRPKGRFATMASVKQESSRFEIAVSAAYCN